MNKVDVESTITGKTAVLPVGSRSLTWRRCRWATLTKVNTAFVSAFESEDFSYSSADRPLASDCKRKE